MERTLSLLIHGESKVGKTMLGDTAPAPRLILDAEGGIKWTPSSKVWWNPATESPPEVGTAGHNGRPWETCVVTVREFETVQRVYQWLASGSHPFRSVVIDSISEVQKRAKDNIAGIEQLDQRMWGALLANMEKLVRDMRDLTMHPTNPLAAVVLIAMTRQTDEKFRPYVQGQLQVTMPYFLDIIGYLFVQNTEEGQQVRRLLVSPNDNYEAGERVGGRLGLVVDSPNIQTMLDTVYGPESDGA